MVSSSDDSSDFDDLNWSYKKRKHNVTPCHGNKEPVSSKGGNPELASITEMHKKFEELKKRSDTIKSQTSRRSQLSERRRTKKLIKKALKDPSIRELVKKNPNLECSEYSADHQKKEWNEVKPFLNVNSHIQGPVSHGGIGPKSEIESIIDDAIKEGDFEKAELLSDTLANKEFAGKICKAFSAKRCHEQLERQKEIEKACKKGKIRWTFEAKQKWEMKGNM